MPEEYAFRDLRATIAANSTRKPDKARDTENLQQILPTLVPFMQTHFQMTGDVSGINGLLTQWGKVIDQDMSAMLLPDLPPPSGNPEAEAAAQQQQLELEQFQQQMAMDQQRHQQQLVMNSQKAEQGQQMHEAKLQQMQQMLAIKKKQAAQRPKAKARAA
jgi:hypothetical protein